MIITTEGISIARQAEDIYGEATGRYTAGSIATFAAEASVQPMTGRELMLLPEADRIKDVVRIYSEFEILVADIVTQSSTGKEYFIKRVDNWLQYDLPHVKAIGYLKDDA